MRLSRPWQVVAHLMCLAICLAIVGPMLLVLGTSFKPYNEIFSPYPWPQTPTLDNYIAILTNADFLTYLWNSVGTTFFRVIGQIGFSVITAYAFARYEFRFRDPLFYAVLGAMMIPPQLTMIPNYILIANLGWFDTWTGIIVPNLVMPLGIFLLRQHMLAFPKELFDAAEVDGANSLKQLWLILLPNLRPAIGALTIVVFIEAWNEYFWPLLISESPASETLQIGLRKFLNEETGDDFGRLMAGVVLVSLPSLAIFFAFQRQVLETFVSSGLKG